MAQPPEPEQFDLTRLPAGARLRSVTAAPGPASGRTAPRVELTDAVTLRGTPGLDYIDMPTFVIIPAHFASGTIEVDILCRLNGKGPSDAHAFAGIAFHITDDGDQFEAVYLRPLNGAKTNPPPPRHQRAVQYFAYRDWKFDRLREEYPDGRYEAGADIGPDEWIHLKLDINRARRVVCVNGTETLVVTEPQAAATAATAGAVGLFVDIGTEAYFSNLQVTSAG